MPQNFDNIDSCQKTILKSLVIIKCMPEMAELLAVSLEYIFGIYRNSSLLYLSHKTQHKPALHDLRK